MTKEDIERIGKLICESEFCKKFIREDSWLSGCSTLVYPVMAWKRYISIQLKSTSANGRSACMRKLMTQLKKEFPKLTALFSRNTSEYLIYYND